MIAQTVDPGWVKTKMANYNAPVSIKDGSKTQVWLCKERVNNGIYFNNMKEISYSPKADDLQMQDILIKKYEEITNIKLNSKELHE